MEKNICKNGEDRQEKRKAGIHRERERGKITPTEKKWERENQRE